MLYWPRGLISAGLVGWKLETPKTDAGANLAGQPQDLFLSGGPCWSLSFDQLFVRGRDPILAARAVRAALGNGQRPITIASCDCNLLPLADGESLGVVPNTDGSPFDDFQAGEANPMVASFAAAFALRAAIVTLTLTSGIDVDEIVGSEFGVLNATWGWRKHRIIERTGGTDEAPQVRIRPLLRAAVANGQAVNFNRPACVMQLASDFALDRPGASNRLRSGRVSFVEYGRPIA